MSRSRRYTWGRIGLTLDTHKHKPRPIGVQHGPLAWEWWRLFKVSIVWCGWHPQCQTPQWNIWVYTRWGAWCHNLAISTKPDGSFND